MKLRRIRLVSAVVTGLLVAATAGAALPTPESAFGFTPGADHQLVDYEQLTGYLGQLAAASPRLELREVGRSPLDRPMDVLFISAPDNIRRLEALRDINRRLALDPDIPAAERAQLIRDGRVFVLATLSMHSSEVGPSQALPRFAYEMAATTDPAVLARLESVVLMIVPNHNPDGMDMVVANYRKYLGTPLEGCSLPRVYHRYVGHDNNRDFVTLTQADTRVISRLYSTEWYPQVMVEKHQMGMTGPRYFVPPNHDPIAENVDAGLWDWMAVFGSHLARDLGHDGLKGVVHEWEFDNYWPGSTETCLWKGVVSFLTEAASCKVATPVFIEPTELSVDGKGLAEYKKSVNMPDPWPGGWWRLGDIVDLELASMRSLLATAAAARADLLRFRNDLTRREVAAGRSEAPFYFVLPPTQHDRGALPALTALLREHGVELARLTEATVVDGRALPADSVVVPLAQPFRAFVKEVMEAQHYPVRHLEPGGEVIRPYDVTSWSLPLHFGLTAYQVDTRSTELESHLEPLPAGPLTAVPRLPFGVSAVAYSADDNLAFKAAFLAWANGLAVARLQAPAHIGDTALPAGSFVIRTAAASGEALRAVVEGVPVAPVAIPDAARLDARPLERPRIGLVETYFHDMDAGWTRFVFDSYGIPFTVLHPADLASTDLAASYDVLVFPDADSDVLMEGKYKREGHYRLGNLPPEYAKGMGDEGRTKVAAFLGGGGVVLSWRRSTALFTGGLEIPVSNDLNVQLPVRDLTEGLEKQELLVPGSLLEVRLTPDLPLTWGMPATVGVFSRGEPAFATSVPRLDTDRRVVASYPEHDQLLSGYAEHADALGNAAAMVWLRAGKGQLVLYGFNPQFRASTPATFKLLFNGLLLPPAQRAPR